MLGHGSRHDLLRTAFEHRDARPLDGEGKEARIAALAYRDATDFVCFDSGQPCLAGNVECPDFVRRILVAAFAALGMHRDVGDATLAMQSHGLRAAGRQPPLASRKVTIGQEGSAVAGLLGDIHRLPVPLEGNEVDSRGPVCTPAVNNASSSGSKKRALFFLVVGLPSLS